MSNIYVTRDFKQGSEATIVAQFDDFVEITTDTPENYTEWTVLDESGELAILKQEVLNKLKKTEGLLYTLNGIDYMIPLSSEDAVGLMQVSSAFNLGLTNTNIHFSNGTIVPINATDFEAFATWFITERNKLFI